MKIRFGANDIVDTTQTGGTPEGYEEVESAALNTKAELDDDSTSYEDQTQLNILKRFVKGFLATLGDGCGRADLNGKQPVLVNKLYLEFDDILSSISDESGWLELSDAIQYDEKTEEAGE